MKAFCLLLFGLALPVVCLAQDPTEQDLIKAKASFEAAQGFYEIKEFQKALDNYKDAYELTKKTKPAILFNIAQCYRQLGEGDLATIKENYPKAIQNYTEFLQKDPQTPYKPEVQYRIASLNDALGNKQEALDRYKEFLSTPSNDPNRSQAEKRVAELPQEIALVSNNKPNGNNNNNNNNNKDPETSLGKKLLLPIALGGTGAVLGGTAFVLSKTQGGTDCLPGDNTPCTVKAPASLFITAIAGDVLGISALVLGGITLMNHKKDQAKSSPSLGFVPSPGGAFVTFTYQTK